MNYEIVTLEKKIVAGVSARTSNNSPDMYSTIGGLWQKLYGGIAQSMKNRTNKKAIGLYCDYNEDGTYTVLTGCEVTADPQDGNLDVKRPLCKIHGKRRCCKGSRRQLERNLEHTA